jgi:hypothetical protein
MLCAFGCPCGAQIDPAAWREAERGVLEDHVQLTSADRFIKAGEAYFSPDDSRIIFQAIEQPADGQEPETFFQMYVADVVHDEAGRIRGLDNYTRLSPPGSWNTCGWFHPTTPGIVIFGSTIVAPKNPEAVGFQRGVGRYSWWFPKEMTIVECDLATADGTAATLTPLVKDDEAYVAECVLSPDGRYLAYCRRAEKDGPLGGDLIIRDLTTGAEFVVAGAPGYDGGPFFSPDGKRLCYRSDRKGDDLLQVFVAELAFDFSGSITGVEREFQLTDENAVNWAPWWTRDGRFLLYTTSALGHENYEVFLMDADSGRLQSREGPAKYGTRQRRITHADRFDGLPALNSDGSVMIWTSQRAGDGSSQLWAARFVLDLDDPAALAEAPKPPDAPLRDDFLHVVDPEDGTIYVYNVKTHEVSIYDPVTHAVTPVTDEVKFKRASELFADRDRKGG